MDERYCQVDCEQNSSETGCWQYVGSINSLQSQFDDIKGYVLWRSSFSNRIGHPVTYVLDETDQ